MNGLSFVHLELTSRCNKGDGTPGSGCFMCGRRKLEREHPELCNWGDMDYEMVRVVAAEIPHHITVQCHSNGDPLLYPYLGDALGLFRNHIRCFNTNGKLLLDRSAEIIGNVDTITISVIPRDPERKHQYETVTRFLEIKGNSRPNMVYRLLGRIGNQAQWRALPGIIVKRVLHNPMRSRDYEKEVVKPEIGFCTELLNHLAIDRHGNISLCVRFDPEGSLRIGHVSRGIWEAWNSEKRRTYIQYHIDNKRSQLPGCKSCHYWGVPRS